MDTGGVSAKVWREMQEAGARKLRPKRIKLGAYTIPVKYHKGYLVSEDDGAVSENYEDGDLGTATLVDDWRMHISDHSPDPANTLLHEVLHLAMRVTGSYRLLESRDDEEAIVGGMAHSITEMLRRNPGLGDYLTRGR